MSKFHPCVFHIFVNHLLNNPDFNDMKEEINLQFKTSDLSNFDKLNFILFAHCFK